MRILVILFFTMISMSTYGLEEQDISFINEYELVKTNVRSRTDDWSVNSAELDVDRFKFKGQDANTTDWKNLSTKNWFSIREWKNERKFKDANLEWRKKLRETSYSEKVGRVLKCVGVCGNFRGETWVKSDYQTVLKEGDEFTTEKNSFAWIVLVDGSILKVSPNTSVTLHEFNISRTELFVMLRLNKGFISYKPRLIGDFKVIDRPESDLSFSPLSLLEANREYYTIQDYRKLSSEDRLNYAIKENPGHESQLKKLNALMKENNPLFEKRNTRFYIYTPNVSIEGSNIGLDLFYEPNSTSHFYLSNSNKNFNKTDKRFVLKYVYRRGYSNRELFYPELNQWYEVDKFGENVSKSQKFANQFNISRALNERIPSIYLARELWIKQFSAGALDYKIKPMDLAIKHGYRLWDFQSDSETFSRLEFVKEYVRRVETTNLKSLDKLLKGKVGKGFDNTYYARAMRLHYNSLRSRFNEEHLKVREMSNTHYYLWALRNGKK